MWTLKYVQCSCVFIRRAMLFRMWKKRYVGDWRVSWTSALYMYAVIRWTMKMFAFTFISIRCIYTWDLRNPMVFSNVSQLTPQSTRYAVELKMSEKNLNAYIENEVCICGHIMYHFSGAVAYHVQIVTVWDQHMSEVSPINTKTIKYAFHSTEIASKCKYWNMLSRSANISIELINWLTCDSD